MTNPQVPVEKTCGASARSVGSGYLCTQPQGHRGDHRNGEYTWPNEHPGKAELRVQVLDAATKFVRLSDEPQPGLATWHIAMENAYQDLLALLQREKRENNETD